MFVHNSFTVFIGLLNEKNFFEKHCRKHEPKREKKYKYRQRTQKVEETKWSENKNVQWKCKYPHCTQQISMCSA